MVMSAVDTARPAWPSLTKTVNRSAPLGVFEETPYPTQRTSLGLGETLVIYSDGVSEAMDARARLFGAEGIAASVRGRSSPSSTDLMARIVAAVQSHQGEAPQADDITLIALRRVERDAIPRQWSAGSGLSSAWS